MKPLSFCCRHAFPSGFQLDARFEVAAPVTALFGPSGAGKSTVLYAITGLLQPDQGEIRLGDTTFLSTAQRICLPPRLRHIGLVFQDYLLFPHLSVERNLRYGERRRTTNGIDFDRVIKVLELDKLLDRRPKNLSGGERQRVAMGRALLSRPELLLMDEPLAALDQQLKDRILDYLERVIAEWHIPTIYVSHTIEDVRRLANQVVLMSAGQVTKVGAPADVL